MIQRKDFVRLMNRRAEPLIRKSLATNTTLKTNAVSHSYLTPALKELLDARPRFPFDKTLLQAYQAEYMALMAELEDKYKVMQRHVDSAGSATIDVLALCPEDMSARLKHPDLQKGALLDWELADNFATAFAYVDIPARINWDTSKKGKTDASITLAAPTVEKVDQAIRQLHNPTHNDR